MTDPRIEYGLQVEPRVIGPYSVRPAKRNGTGNDGGTLDCAIIAHTEDGRMVVIGEVWAAGHGMDGSKIRIDAAAVARQVIDALKATTAE